MADGQPISRQEICNAAVQNKVYSGASIPNFVGGEIVDGKRYDNSKVKSRLQCTVVGKVEINYFSIFDFLGSGQSLEDI